MQSVTINTDIISSPQAEAYFTNADRRVMIGLRATLEMLQLPVPDYAQRRLPGVTPAKSTLAAFNADNPAPRPNVLPDRKPSVSPERAAAVAALNASGLGTASSLVFGGASPIG